MLTLNTPLVELHLHSLPRVGQVTAHKLAVEMAAIAAKPDAREATVEDLLHYLPMRYEDRSHLAKAADLRDGQEASSEVMVRVGGLTYTCTPGETMGKRISDMRLGGKPIEAGKTYKVASWAPVAEGVKGEPIWDVVTRYLRDRATLPAPRLNLPKLVGVEGNPGIA